MLVLTRRQGERLIIDDKIIVSIVDVDRGKIRLGIEAPANVRVDREEVYEQRRREKSLAVSS